MPDSDTTSPCWNRNYAFPHSPFPCPGLPPSLPACLRARKVEAMEIPHSSSLRYPSCPPPPRRSRPWPSPISTSTNLLHRHHILTSPLRLLPTSAADAVSLLWLRLVGGTATPPHSKLYHLRLRFLRLLSLVSRNRLLQSRVLRGSVDRGRVFGEGVGWGEVGARVRRFGFFRRSRGGVWWVGECCGEGLGRGVLRCV